MLITVVVACWFQFTHPGKGATSESDREAYLMVVSIHAPWEGCDMKPKKSSSILPRFQFTHPGKGATMPLQLLGVLLQVSIHAPWEGCDTKSTS